ncbi:MAG: DnaJ like chaperone protein [Chlamydiales bacterium]|jgi:DnaJ like chaperone protein
MGIFGTIVGGTLGFMMGGPLGAILGGSLGSSITQGAPGQRRAMGGSYSARDQQGIFAVALTTLAARVAKADGQVTQDEVETFDRFLRDSLRMSVEDRKFAARIFNEARDSDTPTAQFSRQVHSVFGGQRDRLRDIVTILLTIALADGHLHTEEDKLIRQIAADMGLTEADYESCRATFFAATGHSDTSPYEVLGVSSSATNDELKSAHRRLVREYHPDVLQSKGLPDDFMQFATDKLSAINDAWSRVKKERAL